MLDVYCTPIEWLLLSIAKSLGSSGGVLRMTMIPKLPGGPKVPNKLSFPGVKKSIAAADLTMSYGLHSPDWPVVSKIPPPSCILCKSIAR